MQSGSIYAEQLDPDLFAANVDHVMKSCYWSHVTRFRVRVILQDTLLKLLAERRLGHSKSSLSEALLHLRALYQDANEFNTFHQSQRRRADEVSTDVSLWKCGVMSG